LFIDEVGISRLHARVVSHAQGFEIIDEQSTNGTFVNGDRIARHVLRDGDIVQVGSATVLRYSSRDFVDRNEAALRQALVAANIGVWDFTLRTGLITWSEQADRALATPSGSMSHRRARLIDQVALDDQPRLEQALAAAVTGSRLEIELRLDVPTRGFVWVSFQGDLIRDATGEPERITGTVMDIAQRKLRESELRRQSLLFESLYDAVVLFDLDGTILDCNTSAERLFPRAKPEMRGRLVFSLFERGEPAQLLTTCLASIAEHGRWTTETEVHSAQGVLSCEVVVVQLRDASETAIGHVMVLHDVTERKKLQAQLIFADRLSSLGTLAAGVGHEINNPLSFVMANLGFVEEELTAGTTSTEEMVSVIRDCQSGVKRIAAIVRDLRTFSRSDRDETPVEIDVAKCVSLACSMAANEIRHRARLTRIIEEVPGVMGQESRLGQIVLNLLINAAQAIPAGQVADNEVRVRVFSPSSDNVCIEVSDSGSGMTPEVQARIFDPFFTTKPVGGSGLGLAICHGLVTAMGGSIVVKSAPKAGSTFTVTLPVGQGAGPTPAEHLKAAAKAPDRHGKILVVDDEERLVAAIVRVLSPTQEVRAVTSAKDALALFAAGERFDMVLSDLMMPEMTGMDFYEQLERSMPDQALKVIFMTGGAFTEQAAQFIGRFPQRVVSKPLDLAELRRLVDQQLSPAAVH
jgi:PAS domain S-box-containing protein